MCVGVEDLTRRKCYIRGVNIRRLCVGVIAGGRREDGGGEFLLKCVSVEWLLTLKTHKTHKHTHFDAKNPFIHSLIKRSNSAPQK